MEDWNLDVYFDNTILLLLVLWLQVELVCRVATVLLQLHHNQLITTVAARPILTLLKDILHARVKVI